MIAINQIGIAANLINTLFIGLVAALAIAVGLAFGLGGRDVAADITRSWYESSKIAADRVRASGALSSTGESSAAATPATTTTAKPPASSSKPASTRSATDPA